MYDAISPLEFRYLNFEEAPELRKYLSENGFIHHLALVESKLVTTFARHNLCSSKIAMEVENAVDKVSAQQVYEEEHRIHHQLRAVVNCLKEHVSDEAKPWIHLGSTSHDIVCTADSLRYKECTVKLLMPALIDLEKTLIEIAEREKETVQIGRTHGQHAVPITFGFAISSYVSRLGNKICDLKKAAHNLRGQYSGAVGAYNAQSLFIKDPIAFEKDFLHSLGLQPGDHSTQIIEPEYMLDYLHVCTSIMGILANLGDDMRHLQRTEIGEVMEKVATKQVGSSTMPHKRNPIHFEHVKSLWKTFMPRITSVYMDQISEHQRDLTNSASTRFYSEMIVAVYLAVRRTKRAMKSLLVDKDALQKNLDLSKDKIVAEPLYIFLALKGHPDAHEAVRSYFLENNPLLTAELSATEKEILENPQKYIGCAVEKTEKTCSLWREKLGL